MKKIQEEKGVALVISIFFLLAVLLLVFSMTRMIQNEIDFLSYNSNREKALYAAEAAVVYGTAVFNTDGTLINDDGGGHRSYEINSTSFNDLNLLFDEAEITKLEWTINDNSEIAEFHAEASSDGVSDSVTASYSIYNSILDSALAANYISVNNNQMISTGKIKSANEIDGIIINESGEEVKAITENFIIPDLNFEDLRSIANNYINTDLTSNSAITTQGEIDYENIPDYSTEDDINEINDIADQFTYIDGDLVIGNSFKAINGSGVIVVNGTLTMGNNLEINKGDENEDENLIFLVKGSDIEDNGVKQKETASVEAGNSIFMRGLIYTEGSFTAKNNLDIYGSIIAGGNIDLKNTKANEEPNINYRSKFVEILSEFGITFSQEESEIYNIYQIINWSEI